jgi:hypothetical protein
MNGINHQLVFENDYKKAFTLIGISQFNNCFFVHTQHHHNGLSAPYANHNILNMNIFTRSATLF